MLHMHIFLLLLMIVPFTSYGIQIAAVTIAGPGNFSQPTVVSTLSSGKS